MKYTYRNFPCNVVEDASLWCVIGEDKTDGFSGVLEWCINPPDAAWILSHMEMDKGRFENLKAIQWSAV